MRICRGVAADAVVGVRAGCRGACRGLFWAVGDLTHGACCHTAGASGSADNCCGSTRCCVRAASLPTFVPNTQPALGRACRLTACSSIVARCSTRRRCCCRAAPTTTSAFRCCCMGGCFASVVPLCSAAAYRCCFSSALFIWWFAAACSTFPGPPSCTLASTLRSPRSCWQDVDTVPLEKGNIQYSYPQGEAVRRDGLGAGGSRGGRNSSMRRLAGPPAGPRTDSRRALRPSVARRRRAAAPHAALAAPKEHLRGE